MLRAPLKNRAVFAAALAAAVLCCALLAAGCAYSTSSPIRLSGNYPAVADSLEVRKDFHTYNEILKKLTVMARPVRSRKRP